MQEIDRQNTCSMFQQIETHMRDIFGKKESTQQSTLDLQPFMRKREVREAYAIFNKLSKPLSP